jgi:K+-sensing histidine kinase KdpD
MRRGIVVGPRIGPATKIILLQPHWCSSVSITVMSFRPSSWSPRSVDLLGGIFSKVRPALPPSLHFHGSRTSSNVFSRTTQPFGRPLSETSERVGQFWKAEVGNFARAPKIWSWEHGQDAGRSTDILSAAQAQYMPLKARGEVIGVLGLEVKPGAFISQSAFAIERGLLERKMRRLRFLEESSKVQNAVLSAISHDVRTPLAAITASLSGLLSSDGALNQVAERRLLETADLEARRLNRLVNNLLSMTRLETGVSMVQTEPHDLLDVVSAALEEMGPSPSQRQVSLDIPEDLPLVPMDFGLITHVFINLFSNAFKYSRPDQSVDVRGRIINDQLEVLVVDRGVGVPPEDLCRVFDKFYRVAEFGSSTGLGLGLAICKAFIEAHDGRINLEENPMGGTIVRFAIPFRGTGAPSVNPKLQAFDNSRRYGMD